MTTLFKYQFQRDMEAAEPMTALPVTHPFEKALEELINKHSMENESDTPDYILAQYMFTCLSAYQNAIKARDKWFGVNMWSENKLEENKY